MSADRTAGPTDLDAEAVARAVAAPINLSGARFYFAPGTLAEADRLGLDPLLFYYLGRGGVLGDTSPEVVTSAFGFMRADLIERMWTSGRQVVSPTVAGAAYFECSAAVGRLHCQGLELASFCSMAEGVIERTDPAGMALFAGIAALPRAEDYPGRAVQLLTVLRELRGCAHLICLLAMGIEPRVAHFARRPDYFGAFGWEKDDVPVPADDLAQRLDEAEAWTDRLLAPALAGIPAGDRPSFIATVEEMHRRLQAAAPVHQPDPEPDRLQT